MYFCVEIHFQSKNRYTQLRPEFSQKTQANNGEMAGGRRIRRILQFYIQSKKELREKLKFSI